MDNKKEAKTVVDKIRRLLFNYDMAIVYAKGEISFREADMELYRGKGKVGAKKYAIARIDKERYEIYIEKIENAKSELLENLSIMLSKYNNKYKQVFMLFFIESKSYQEIADITHYSFEAVKYIIKRLKRDLLTMFMA